MSDDEGLSLADESDFDLDALHIVHHTAGLVLDSLDMGTGEPQMLVAFALDSHDNITGAETRRTYALDKDQAADLIAGLVASAQVAYGHTPEDRHAFATAIALRTRAVLGLYRDHGQ